MVDFGPLTTTFTAPLTCASSTGMYSVATDGHWVQGPLNTRDCFPSGYSPGDYYSPGVCPYGYTTACSSQNSIGSLTETIVTCCPGYQQSISYSCLSYPNSAFPWQSTLGCTSNFPASFVLSAVTVISNGETSTLTSLSGGGGGIGAYSVQVRFQTTDIAATARPISTATTNSPTISASTTLAPIGSGSGGISSGAAAGIGVGSAIGAFLLAGIAFCLWKRRRLEQPTGSSIIYTTPALQGMVANAQLRKAYEIGEHEYPRYSAPVEMEASREL